MCTHNVLGHGIGCQAVRTPYIYSDKHTSAREAIQISPPNLSEGGTLRSPITREVARNKIRLNQVMLVVSHYIL